jgi:hypothetical protein
MPLGNDSAQSQYLKIVQWATICNKRIVIERLRSCHSPNALMLAHTFGILYLIRRICIRYTIRTNFRREFVLAVAFFRIWQPPSATFTLRYFLR